MKTIIVLLVVFNTIVLTTFSQKKTSNSYEGALEISSSALFNDEKTSCYAVSVFLDGHRLDSVFVKTRKPVHMYLDYDKVYTFLFQKDNCRDKIVILNTKVPAGLKAMQDETFDFKVEMTQTITRNCPETEDLPVAVVMINKSEELLEASENYFKLTHNKDEVDALAPKVSSNENKK
jgi:hypothetical protein